MQCTSICSPLEGKEMGKGCVETNSNTFYNLAGTPAFQMYLMLWAPRWKMNRAELGEMHLGRTLAQTQLCVCVGRATFDQSISILSMQTSALVLAAASPSSLLLSSPSICRFLTFCCSAHIFDQTFVAVVTQRFGNFSFLIADGCYLVKCCSPR